MGNWPLTPSGGTGIKEIATAASIRTYDYSQIINAESGEFAKIGSGVATTMQGNRIKIDYTYPTYTFTAVKSGYFQIAYGDTSVSQNFSPISLTFGDKLYVNAGDEIGSFSVGTAGYHVYNVFAL